MSLVHRLACDEKAIGTGAFSTVVIGTDPTNDNRYAVKRVEKKFILMAQEESRKKMLDTAKREYEMLSICNHRNIIKFFGSGQSAEYLLYVLELCEGGELLDAVKSRPFVPLEACRYTMAELFSAVFYLHSGRKRVKTPRKDITILHRDIKPENIMLSGDFHVKLIDFGTAVTCQTDQDHARSENNQLGRAQTLCGTSYYMSPELLGDSYTCCASDFWACGCVLFYLLTGRRPFDAPTDYWLMRVILEGEPFYPPSMDPEAADLIRKLLVKSPEKRIGMDGVKKHPFFSSVDFSTLHTIDMKELWMTETPWVDDSQRLACAECRNKFGWRRAKDFCRACGDIFCTVCVATTRDIPCSRFTSPQPVCKSCATKL